MKSQKSFTLIELLVVIAIVGLISSIVMVNLDSGDKKQRARIAKSLSFSQSVQNVAGSEAAGIWTFDDCTTQGAAPPGGIVKDSAFGNNGSVSGALCSQNTPQAILGQGSGKWALSFDGADDYVNAGNGASLNITGAITVEAWIKVTATGNNMVVNKYSDLEGWDLNIRTPANAVRFIAHVSGGETDITTVNSISLNAWHHVAATYDGANYAIYIDGVRQSYTGTTKTGNILANSNWVGIGRRQVHPSYLFNGLIDEVRIYGKSLTIGEIQQHYAEGLKNHSKITQVLQ